MAKPYFANLRVKSSAKAMQVGGCIAYPTEAVWGLGCDPFNYHAVARILELKHRSVDKGLILVAGKQDDFTWLLESVDDSVRKKMSLTWPGPTTWLVPHYGRVPDAISGGRPKVAIRVSKHPVIVALSEQFGGAFVSTSANPQGLPAARTSVKVRCYFRYAKDLTICAGFVGRRHSESTIIDSETGAVLRP